LNQEQQKFLHLKKCVRTETKGFRNYKNRVQSSSPHPKNPPNKCLQCQNIKTRTKCDETLPTINKPKHPKKKGGQGVRKYKEQNGKDPHPRRQMNHLRGQIKGSLFFFKNKGRTAHTTLVGNSHNLTNQCTVSRFS
jgi:hypothetical protein